MLRYGDKINADILMEITADVSSVLQMR